MLKWLILGIVVALVSHWSSKVVHADTPLSEEEEALLRQLRSEIGNTPDIDERDPTSPWEELCKAQCGDDDDCFEACLEDLVSRREFMDDETSSCEEDCQDTDDPDMCEDECENSKRMLQQVRSQEARQEGMLDSEINVSKKLFRRRRGRRWIRLRRVRIRIPKVIAAGKAVGWWGKK